MIDNRIFKFRGQDRDKKWHFGDLHHYWDGSVGIREIENKYGFVVQPDTVGQFTGLTDVDGNEIFEDDIIQNEVNPFEIYQVAMVNGCCSAMNHIDCGVLHWFLENAPYKIIGNFHDNPNLLNEGVHYD